MQYRIRLADKRHHADIARLIVESNIGAATVEEQLADLPGQFWFVRVDGQIVGCMGAEIIGDGVAVLTHLAVEKSYRKQGIGMQLFAHAIDYVCAEGVTTIGFITMYYHFNRFKKRGFVVTKRRDLPDNLRGHWMFTSKRYMKCVAMVREY